MVSQLGNYAYFGINGSQSKHEVNTETRALDLDKKEISLLKCLYLHISYNNYILFYDFETILRFDSIT